MVRRISSAQACCASGPWLKVSMRRSRMTLPYLEKMLDTLGLLLSESLVHLRCPQYRKRS